MFQKIKEKYCDWFGHDLKKNYKKSSSGKWEIADWDPLYEYQSVTEYYECTRCDYTQQNDTSNRIKHDKIKCLNMEYCTEFPRKCFCCDNNKKRDYYEPKDTGECII